MKLKNLYFIIGIAIFIFLLTRIRISEVFSILKEINLFLLIVAILIYLIYHSLRITAWKYLLLSKNIEYKFKDLSLIHFAGNYLGLITPGRLGDIAKAYYLKKDGHSFIKSLTTVFVDRIFDLSFLFIIGYIMMFLLASFFKVQIFWMTILFLIGISILLIFLVNKSKTEKLIMFLLNKFIPDKHKEKVKIGFYDFYSELKHFKRKYLIFVFIIISLAWLIYFFQMYIIAIALNINITFFYVILCLSIGSLLAIIPISISGIGTRDLAFVFIFAILGLTKESAISFSLMTLFFMLLLAVFGLICWFIKPIKINNNEV